MDWVWCWQIPEIVASADMFRSIGAEKSQGLLAFHAFAGCDQTMPFCPLWRKDSMASMGCNGWCDGSFPSTSKAPVMYILDEVMPIIFLSDKSACIMYDRTSTFRKVNDAQGDLFTRKGRYIEAIPPTSDALIRFPVERDTTQDSTKMS